MLGKQAKEWYKKTGITNHYMDNVRGDLVGRTFVGRKSYKEPGVVKILVVKETNCYVDFKVLYENGSQGKTKRDSKGMCGLEMCVGAVGEQGYETVILNKEGK